MLYFQTNALQIINPEMAPLHIDGDHAANQLKNLILKFCLQLLFL